MKYDRIDPFSSATYSSRHEESFGCCGVRMVAGINGVDDVQIREMEELDGGSVAVVMLKMDLCLGIYVVL